jgi:hypothetical protein
MNMRNNATPSKLPSGRLGTALLVFFLVCMAALSLVAAMQGH